MLRRHFMTNSKIVPDITITYTASRNICHIPVGYEISENLEGIYGNEPNSHSHSRHSYRVVINSYDYSNNIGTIGLKILSIGKPFTDSFITEKLLTSGTQINSILRSGSGGSVKSSLNNHNKQFGYMSWNGSINNIIGCDYFDDFDNRDIHINNISISEGVELITGLVTPSILSDGTPLSPLTGDIKLPLTLRAIGVGAFFGVRNVSNIIITEFVKYICPGAFAACTSNILMTPLNPPKIDTIFGEKYPENDFNLKYIPPTLDNGYNIYYDKEANIKLFNYNMDNYKNDEKWKDHIDRMSECDTYFYAFYDKDVVEPILDKIKQHIISDVANEYCFSTTYRSNNNDAIVINTKITNDNNIKLYNNTMVKASEYYINNKLMSLSIINNKNDDHLQTLIIKNIAKINANGNYLIATNYDKLLHFEYDAKRAWTNGTYYAFGFNDISTFIIGENVKYLPSYFVKFNNSALEYNNLIIPDNVEMIDEKCFDISAAIWNIRLGGNLKYVSNNIFNDMSGYGQNYYYNLKLFIPGIENNRLDFLANLKNVSNSISYSMFINEYVNLYINDSLAQNKDLYIGINPNDRSLNSLNLIGCTIKFLDNVNTIGDNTFWYTKCSVFDLTNIKHIGNNIWVEANKVILSNSIEFIGDEAFKHIKSIEGDVKNLPNLDYVGWRAFNNELENKLNLGEGIIYLGNTLYKQKGVLENNTLICKEGIKYVNLDIDPSIENIVLPDGIVKINLLSISSFKETQFYKNQPDNEPVYIGNYYICFKGNPTKYNGVLIKEGTVLTADRIAETNFGAIKLTNLNFDMSSLIRIGDYSLREFYIESGMNKIIPNNISLGKGSVIIQDTFRVLGLITDISPSYDKNAIYVNNYGVIDLTNCNLKTLNGCASLYNVETLLLPRTLEKIAVDDFISYNGKTHIMIQNTIDYWDTIKKEKYWDAPFRKYNNKLHIQCSDGYMIYDFIEDSINYHRN